MMNNLPLKIQFILTYISIAFAILFFVFSLGFMSFFYILFMDGNSEMYAFFKDIQILNNIIFQSSLIYLIMTLFLSSFDINKNTAGILGVLYTLSISILNIVNGLNTLTVNQYFTSIYSQFDFKALEGYKPSLFPFQLVGIFIVLMIVLSASLFIVTGGNYIQGKRKGGQNENS